MNQTTQTGVALAILLWFIAALTLLVSSLAMLAKTDTRYSQLYLDRAQVAALGDGAAHMIVTTAAESQPLYQRRYRLGNADINVRAIPATGLINIRVASEDLLTRMFHDLAGLELSQAEQLGRSVVQWRTEVEVPDETKTQGQFTGIGVLEDIMSVPGVSRDIFEAVRPVLQVAKGGRLEINLEVAPPEVVRLVVGAEADLAEQGMSQATENEPDLFSDVRMSKQLTRIDARVKLASGRVYERSVWMEPGSGVTGWQITRRHPVRAVGMLEFNDMRNYGDK